jgi:hypothetical protein
VKSEDDVTTTCFLPIETLAFLPSVLNVLVGRRCRTSHALCWEVLILPSSYFESFLASLLDPCQCVHNLIWSNLAGKDRGELGFLASEGLMLAKEIRNLFGHLVCLLRDRLAVLVVL